MKKDKESKKDNPASAAVKADAAPVAGPVEIRIGKDERSFDINDPTLPDWIDKKALMSGNYPYDDKLPQKEYEQTLEQLQIELVKLQAWMQATGKRVLILFEGCDAAGCCRFAGGPYLAPEYLGTGLAIATTPGNAALTAAFDCALHEISAKGTFAELYLRYFPVSFF